MAGITKRNGHYRITVSCGYDIYGKKLSETTTFTPDPTLSPKKQEKTVMDFAHDFEAKVKSGLSMTGGKITLKEFSERWIAEYANVNLQPGTVTKYLQELNDKILPALGHLKLSELRPHRVNSFFASLTQDGIRRDGKPGGYSKGSIRKTRNVLSSILRTATEWEIINSNPCDKVRLQAMDMTESVKFFTPEQTATFLAYIEAPYTVHINGHKRIDDTGHSYAVGEYTVTKTIPEQLRILFNLAIYTGLRKGELLALQWEDIDCHKDLIQVRKSVTMVGGKPVCKAPKTKTSTRTVSIPHFLSKRLEQLHKSQDAFIAQVGDYWQGDTWVFIQDNGKMMNYSTPYQALQDTINRYNKNHSADEQLPLIPFHGLRHTSATLLIASQQDVKTVSNRLGHAQTSTTMNIYAHALKESDRKAADALETMLGERSSTPKKTQ